MNFRGNLRQIMGFYLALALLMVPLLGLMHGIVHGFEHEMPAALGSAQTQGHVQPRAFVGESTHDHGHSHADAANSHASPNQATSHQGWSEALFAGHDKAADCLVFDQLCSADVLHFLPSQALPTALTSVVLVTLAGDFIARWAALFQARGPPSAR
jgi:hypothetical protein